MHAPRIDSLKALKRNFDGQEAKLGITDLTIVLANSLKRIDLRKLSESLVASSAEKNDFQYLGYIHEDLVDVIAAKIKFKLRMCYRSRKQINYFAEAL